MLASAEQAKVVHLVGFEFRFSTGQALATRAIRAGAIGEPLAKAGKCPSIHHL